MGEIVTLEKHAQQLPLALEVGTIPLVATFSGLAVFSKVIIQDLVSFFFSALARGAPHQPSEFVPTSPNSFVPAG